MSVGGLEKEIIKDVVKVEKAIVKDVVSIPSWSYSFVIVSLSNTYLLKHLFTGGSGRRDC